MNSSPDTERNFALEYDDSWSKYDFIVNLFQLGRDRAHRIKALKFAGLKKGDTVLDICCGSGLSFAAIENIIGDEGKIIAIDANSKMLGLAGERMKKNSWKNIELIEADIEGLQLDVKADFAFFALCWYDKEQGRRWIENISKSLKKESGIICFMDYKFPQNWLRHIANPILSLLVKWLGEAYSVEDLKWNPKEEIGGFLENPKMQSIYLNSLVTVYGGVKE